MLKVLPSHIANLIAAGEVVNRPASIVKELVENSIDAGADRISVVIVDAGRTMVQIIDNGCGMNAQDAKTSFLRHATSKIATETDLNKISTYGFRGEALASVAAVAEVTMRTRRAENETGVEICLKESQVASESEVSCPVGTNIMVRNLFCNIPARRKFLKSDNSEYKQIVSEFVHIALVNTEISFTLINNGRTAYECPAHQSFKQRIHTLLGKNVAAELVNVSNSSSVLKIEGFIGRPECCKKNNSHQYLFVNNRFFRSPLLHKAIVSGYESLIQEGMKPTYFIRIEIDPAQVDVNISPTKSEVKFAEEKVLYELTNATVRASLGIQSFMPEMNFDDNVPDIPSTIDTKKRMEQGMIDTPDLFIDTDYNPFEEERKRVVDYPSTSRSKAEDASFGQIDDFSFGFDYAEGKFPEIKPVHEKKATPPRKEEPVEESEPQLFKDSAADGRTIMTVMGKYIITPVKSGIMLVRVIAARERIFYERFRNAAGDEKCHYRTLHPVNIYLSKIEEDNIRNNIEVFRNCGFDFEEDAEEGIRVVEVPSEELLDEPQELRQCIETVLFSIEENSEVNLDYIRERQLIRRAEKQARSFSDHLTREEAEAIVDGLFACSNPEYSPSGEKTITIIKNLDVLFEN